MLRLYIIVAAAAGLFFIQGCSGCSHSGRRKAAGNPSADRVANRTSNEKHGRTVLQMETDHGVRYVWIEINGIRLKFILDTGAGNICISAAEATVLYRQGTLRDEDILDVQYYRDASGRISAGTKINLRSVKVGNRELQHIEATVIDDMEAPLLMGQSVLERFGRISIDNDNNLIIFE